ncbi:MAG TPA: ComEC/Rec2 family competence protein [Bacillota bacterium]|nr:ComEC/Rec2 family competence protein [Bacillota bacterium]
MNKKLNAKSIITLIIAILAVFLVWLDGGLEEKLFKVEVHFIDVGQGDSIYVKTPSRNILIDGGDRGNTTLNYLKTYDVDHLDLVIGTHPHSDHIGGLINVLQEIEVNEVIDPGIVHTSKTFEDYLTIIDEKDIIFTEGRAGTNKNLGNGVRLEIVHPTDPSNRDLNNASIVARLIVDDISFLFTGDAEILSENEILSHGYKVETTILKVGHHGSSTSTGDDFLRAVLPEAAIIMCGEGNSYGHPHRETLGKLAELDIDVYRTDKKGTIIVRTDGSYYDVSTER